MKHKIIVSFSSFILVLVLFIIVSSICHVNQQVSCYIINIMLLFLWLSLMIISVVVLIE